MLIKITNWGWISTTTVTTVLQNLSLFTSKTEITSRCFPSSFIPSTLLTITQLRTSEIAHQTNTLAEGNYINIVHSSLLCCILKTCPFSESCFHDGGTFSLAVLIWLYRRLTSTPSMVGLLMYHQWKVHLGAPSCARPSHFYKGHLKIDNETHFAIISAIWLHHHSYN